MGQYHMIYNLDRKEYIHPHYVGNGLKLMEQVGFEQSTSTALFLLLANSCDGSGGDPEDHPELGRWAGDRILIQGDYAEKEHRGFVEEGVLATFTDISDIARDILEKEFGTKVGGEEISSIKRVVLKHLPAYQ